MICNVEHQLAPLDEIKISGILGAGPGRVALNLLVAPIIRSVNEMLTPFEKIVSKFRPISGDVIQQELEPDVGRKPGTPQRESVQ